MTNLNKAESPILIQSVDNPRVKEWLALHTTAGRQSSQTFIAEGEHLVEMAHRHGFIKEIVIVDATPLPVDYKAYPRTWVSEKVMKKISQLVSPATIIALCMMHPHSQRVGDQVLLIDGVQDPGNLGTILRSAAAFGVTDVICSPSSADPYHDKVVRGSQGALFSLTVRRQSLMEVIQMQRRQHVVIATALHADAMAASRFVFPSQWMLIVGNEGKGVSDELIRASTTLLYLPMQPHIESLNVAIATSILLYLAATSTPH